MDAMAVVRMLLRRWYLVLLPVIAAGVIVAPELLARPAGTSGYNVSIRYTAAQVLEAIPERDGDYQDVWLASELTVDAFTEWVRHSRFIEAVRAELAAAQGQTFDTAWLGFGSDNDKAIGRIDIGWHDPEQLEAIVAAAVTVLTEQNGAIFPQLGGVNAEVELLDEPQIVGSPPPIASRLGPALKLMVALLGGIALALLAEAADPYVRRRAQLEDAAVRVLATVPRK
jgi:capsular polysaccharide biosynthesis protein